MPAPSESKVDQMFINKLALLEKTAFHNHMEDKPVVHGMVYEIGYYGNSTCRICKKQNGSLEYYTTLFRWPEGYKHYLINHNVPPTPEFKQHIMSL